MDNGVAGGAIAAPQVPRRGTCRCPLQGESLIPDIHNPRNRVTREHRGRPETTAAGHPISARRRQRATGDPTPARPAAVPRPTRGRRRAQPARPPPPGGTCGGDAAGGSYLEAERTAGTTTTGIVFGRRGDGGSVFELEALAGGVGRQGGGTSWVDVGYPAGTADHGAVFVELDDAVNPDISTYEPSSSAVLGPDSHEFDESEACRRRQRGGESCGTRSEFADVHGPRYRVPKSHPISVVTWVFGCPIG